MNTLVAISPLDGRYAENVDKLRDFFSEFALIKYRIIIEINYLKALAAHEEIQDIPNINLESNTYLDEIIDNFDMNDAKRIKEIEKITNHDVKAVEYFLKDKIKENLQLASISEFIHFACTSEDINNLAYALMLKNSLDNILLPKMLATLSMLKDFAHQFADIPMLSRTHGQAATPTTVGKEFANFYIRLERQINNIKAIPLLGKINGAVGNFNAHYVAYPNINWLEFGKRFVESLGLEWNAYTTQIEPHDFMAEIFDAFARFNTILIGLNRDMWSYISLGYFTQRLSEKEVGSSTMPHKVNPIDFENSEGNLGLANTIFGYFSTKLPISRWQRDLTDSTVMRNLGVGFGHSFIAYQAICQGLKKLQLNEAKIAKDLDESWEVLAEALQTVMRRYHIEEPYEKLKALTRGKVEQIDQNTLRQFIDSLNLPERVKKELKTLTPATYIGIANLLAKRI
jgi:adenylosuccinate lyase